MKKGIHPEYYETTITCACGKSAGSTRHLPSGELIHEPTQALKLCIHSAATDLELDL